MGDWLTDLMRSLAPKEFPPKAPAHVVTASPGEGKTIAPPVARDGALIFSGRAGFDGVDLWLGTWKYNYSSHIMRRRTVKTHLIDGGYGLHFDPALSQVGALLDVEIDGRLFPRVNPGWRYPARFNVAKVTPNIRCDPWAEYAVVTYRNQNPVFPAYQYPRPWKGLCGSAYLGANWAGGNLDSPHEGGLSVLSNFFVNELQEYNSLNNTPLPNRGVWGAPVGPQGKVTLHILTSSDPTAMHYSAGGTIRVWAGLQPDWDWIETSATSNYLYGTQNATGWRLWGNIALATDEMTYQLPSATQLATGGLVPGSRIYPELFQVTTLPLAVATLGAFVESW